MADKKKISFSFYLAPDGEILTNKENFKLCCGRSPRNDENVAWRWHSADDGKLDKSAPDLWHTDIIYGIFKGIRGHDCLFDKEELHNYKIDVNLEYNEEGNLELE